MLFFIMSERRRENFRGKNKKKRAHLDKYPDGLQVSPEGCPVQRGEAVGRLDVHVRVLVLENIFFAGINQQ